MALKRAALLSCEVYRSKDEIAASKHRIVLDSCGRVAAIVSAGDRLVAFSGCRNVDDVLRCVDGSFVATRAKDVRVNTAIWQRYSDVLPQLVTILRDAAGPSITFTGHSLGGAVAQLAAHLLPDHLPGMAGCRSVSFGAPFVGDAGYASTIDWTLHTRVVLENDIVPKLTVNADQVHAGRELLLKDPEPSSAHFPLNIVHNHASRKYHRTVCMLKEGSTC